MKVTNARMNISIHILLIILSVLVLIPFLLVLSISFSNEPDIVYFGYKLIPMHFSLDAYKYILQSTNNAATLFQAYKITIEYSVLGTLLSVFFMTLFAYPLSQTGFKGRNIVNFFLYFTMLFSGGLVPTYILNTRYLHMGNTIWIYIIPSLINPWYVFMMRTFFRQIPEEIHESAVMDGANEFRFLFTMLVPLSKPVLATVSLFIFLSKWNEWFVPTLYIDKQNLISLQYLLQRIMNNIQMLQDTSRRSGISLTGLSKIPTETVRMAMAVVVAGPALVIFPFFQRYFVQGLTVGSVKG